MNVRYRVELNQAERNELTAMLGGGKHAACKLKRAQILLAANGGCRDDEIARTVSLSFSTVGRTKRRFVEGNLERALSEEPRPGAERKLTGKEEALLVTTACAKPPAGCKRWTLTKRRLVDAVRSEWQVSIGRACGALELIARPSTTSPVAPTRLPSNRRSRRSAVFVSNMVIVVFTSCFVVKVGAMARTRRGASIANWACNGATKRPSAGKGQAAR